MATDTELVVGAPLTFSIDVEPLHSVAITPQAGAVVIIVPVPGPPGEEGPTGPAGDGAQIFNETPSGDVDGSNVTFATANHFQSGTTAVYVNGLRQRLNDGYTEAIGAVILSDAPESGDQVTIDYTIHS